MNVQLRPNKENPGPYSMFVTVSHQPCWAGLACFWEAAGQRTEGALLAALWGIAVLAFLHGISSFSQPLGSRLHEASTGPAAVMALEVHYRASRSIISSSPC
jgi:hypothetical protein